MKPVKIILMLCLMLSCMAMNAQKPNDEFLHDLYDKMHDSPMQQKIRKIAPMPFGVVFLPWKGCTEQEMRDHFRLMKKLGFTNLKQTMETPEWPESETLRIALEEGIIPFWYGEGGWEDITPELLKKLGIPSDTPIEKIRKDQRMLDYQKKVFEKQLAGWKMDKTEGYIYDHHPDAILRKEDVKLFRKWVREQYPTIQELTNAWNQYEVGIRTKPYQSWNDFDKDPLIKYDLTGNYMIPSEGREYGFVRDILRFKADMYIENVKKWKKIQYPEQPQRAGGEMGLFLPFAARGTDMEGIAEVMKDLGSFYPSIHLAWHFEENDYEVTRCIYMQSSICVDWFKGGWAATWESTGGPQQFSGGKGWERKAHETTPGYTVDHGTITQLLLSYLAGGFKGVGLWSWNYRRAGWESGEYALLNRQNEAGKRAIRAGEIARAADKYRDEIWQARKEPYVGVFVNWDNEAIWAAVSGPNRTHFKNYPIQARVGICRALIDANIPWEHVTATDLHKGLAGRYKVIYLPAQVAVNEDLFPIFEEYIKNGGRLVMDAPGGWWNERGVVLNTGKGSPFERIFGASIADMQYANNVKYNLGKHDLDGFVYDLAPTRANIIETFQSGKPAVTEHKSGKGTAVLLGTDASFSMKRQGNQDMQDWTIRHTMGGIQSPYACDNAIVYRLAAPQADHYFILNDEEKKEVKINTKAYSYTSAADAVTDEVIDLNKPFEVEAYSGRWLRFIK
ncbi:MAG: beta-galactosidase trimerization domain-containing protein [Tannerella sp.]|jgi:beta-galactosidase|nr:beta-galactosidase trimerization domain-containing protein [Tannerella sp.]